MKLEEFKVYNISMDFRREGLEYCHEMEFFCAGHSRQTISQSGRFNCC